MIFYLPVCLCMVMCVCVCVSVCEFIHMVPFFSLQLQELEIECNRLREELMNLRKAVADSTDFDGSGKGSPAAKEFKGQKLSTKTSCQCNEQNVLLTCQLSVQ